jgi:tetratricopeptide (TPR) repeat protein
VRRSLLVLALASCFVSAVSLGQRKPGVLTPGVAPPASAAPPMPMQLAPPTLYTPATSSAQPAPAPAPGAATAPAAVPTGAATVPVPVTHGEGMRAYHEALARKRLGSQVELRGDYVRERLTEGEDLLRDGRTDEAIFRLTDIVESPRFDPYVDSEDGRSMTFVLADALARAGAYEPARAYLRRLIAASGAWDGRATTARRAVRRLAEIAMESEAYAVVLEDLKAVPVSAPEEMRGEIAYITGRAYEAAGDPDGALNAYAVVTPHSRFWAQATYLQGLILVEKGRYKDGENLFCKVADPNRQSNTTPVFADAKFFVVRDLARLALGRVAHEQGRFDDARYYYYLVPKDSDRLAEALYEAATTRYEKKDYQDARELLDELNAIQGHHRYEDEAWILDAYIDLAQCKFESADKKLLGFLARYEPVRNAARRVTEDDRALLALVNAAKTGSDAGGSAMGTSVNADSMRAIAVLLRLDASYAALARRRAVLEGESSGLRLSIGEINDIQKNLATNGGVRAAVDESESPTQRTADAKAALEGVRHAIDDLEAAHAAKERIEPLRQEVAGLEDRLKVATQAATATEAAQAAAAGQDLPDLLRADAAKAGDLASSVEVALGELSKTETGLAKDALHRVDLRLSRLLRRARLGRIESVLGRKRAMEVEIEALNDGVLPGSALDSLDAARFLQDNEEYWPFEGDDWPDEFVGSEAKK